MIVIQRLIFFNQKSTLIGIINHVHNAISQNINGHHNFWTKVGNACHSDAAVREFNKTCFLHAHNWMPNSPCRAQLSTHNNWPPLLIHSTKKTCLEVISSILAKLDMAKNPFGSDFFCHLDTHCKLFFIS